MRSRIDPTLPYPPPQVYLAKRPTGTDSVANIAGEVRKALRRQASITGGANTYAVEDIVHQVLQQWQIIAPGTGLLNHHLLESLLDSAWLCWTCSAARGETRRGRGWRGSCVGDGMGAHRQALHLDGEPV